MANNTVTFDLSLAVKGFNQNLKKVDGKLNNFHKDFKSQAKSSSNAWSSFAGNLAANAVSFAAKGLSNLIAGMGDLARESIELAGIQEAAINDLEVALKGAGSFSRKASKDFQDFASSLQQTSIFGDEAILSTAALGVQMAKLSGDQLKSATLAAANMASALNIDLNTAMTLVAKSTTDNGSGLKRYGVVVEKGATQQETLANAIQSVNDKFSGAALGKINTYEGAIQQASNSYGDMLEEIGFVITKSPVMIDLIKNASKQFVEFGKFVSENKDQISDFVIEGIVFAIGGLQALIPAINPVVTTLKNMGLVFNILQNGLSSGVATISLIFSEMTLGVINSFRIMLEAIPDSLVPDGWKEGLESAAEHMDATSKNMVDQVMIDSEDMANSFNSILNPETVVSEDSIDTINEKLDAFREGVKESNAKFREDELKDKKKHDKDLAKIEKKRSEDLAKEAKKDSDFKEALFGKQVSWEEAGGKERAANLKSTLGTMATLSTSGSKTLATIGKAAAVSTATIDGIAAVQKALASAPPPFNFALAATVGIATAANVAKISGVNFQHGGIVGGSSFAGDNVQANVNSGEMILNRGQQATLFGQINNGGGNSAGMVEAINQLGNRIANMEIVMMADDNEIGRSVSRAVENGIILGRS